MTPKFTNKMLKMLEEQLEAEAISTQVLSLIEKEISRLELTLETI